MLVALAFDRITIPIALYVPLYGPPRHVNVPHFAPIPIVAGVVLMLALELLEGRRPSTGAIWRGIALGVLATLLAGLPRAAGLLLGDPYFTSAYRVYALGFLTAAIALSTWALWRLAADRPAGARLAWPLLAVVAAAIVSEFIRHDAAVATVMLVAAATGTAIAARRLRLPVSLDARRLLLGVLILAFAFRAVFGLQLLARTGGGERFASGSDDGPSYYEKAVALSAGIGSAAEGVLAAQDGFPPAYSFFLAGVLAITRGSLAVVVLLQALAAVAVAVLLYVIGSRVAGVTVGLVAATLFAVDQNLIQDGSTLTPESILLPVMLCSFWSADKYRRTSRLRWLLLAAACVGLAFITRNIVGASVALALALWMLYVGRSRPLRAVRDAVLVMGATLLFSLPVVIATARAGEVRLTNQLAGLAYSLVGNDGLTVENTFLLERGIDPFKDLAGSIGRVLADPLPVLGFLASAAPQRLMTLLFYAPSGSADPIAIVSPTQYANLYGQLLQLLLLAALLVTAVRVARRLRSGLDPLVAVLLVYAIVYVGLFAFLFPPDHPFRYRIPIEPVTWIAEAAGLLVLSRGAVRVWRADARQ